MLLTEGLECRREGKGSCESREHWGKVPELLIYWSGKSDTLGNTRFERKIGLGLKRSCRLYK